MRQPRDNRGTTTGRPQDDCGTITGRLQDDRGTTTGRLNTTVGRSEKICFCVVPGCGSEAPLDGGERAGGETFGPRLTLASAAQRPSRPRAASHPRTHDTNTKPKPLVRLGVTKRTHPPTSDHGPEAPTNSFTSESHVTATPSRTQT